jgi:hypothetical protein
MITKWGVVRDPELTAQEVPKKSFLFVSSGFRCCVNEIFVLLGCYAELLGSYLPTFRDNL